MYYGHQQFAGLKRMTDFERQYAYDAVHAVILAEHRAAKDAKAKAQGESPRNEEYDDG